MRIIILFVATTQISIIKCLKVCSAFQKDSSKFRIKMFAHGFLNDSKRFVIGKCFFITSFTYQRIKYVCKCHNPCLNRNIRSRQSFRIPFTVPFFMMIMCYIFCNLNEAVFFYALQNILNNPCSLFCMFLHLSIFFFRIFPGFS